MPQILFKNLRLLDPRWDEAREGYEVLVEGELIKGFIEGDVLGAGDDVLGVAELGVDAAQQVQH